MHLAWQSDQSMRRIAEDLGVSNESLRRRIIQADVVDAAKPRACPPAARPSVFLAVETNKTRS